MVPKGIGEHVRELLVKGITYNEIVHRLGCSKATVSYHAGKIGLRKKRERHRYDWTKIKAYYDSGSSRSDCICRFGFGHDAWTKAVKDGRIQLRSWEEKYLIRDSVGSRTHIKSYLLKHKLLRNLCAVCGHKPVWRKKKLVLVLDHMNGINDDYRLSNLRLLCPNCNSQTPTFSGRNRK